MPNDGSGVGIDLDAERRVGGPYCSARASANPASGVWHNAGSVGCSSDHAASCCAFCQASPNSDLDGEDALLANRSPTRSDRYERLPAWVFALWNLLSVARWPASGQSLLAGTGSPGWPHLTIPIWHGCGTRGHQQRFGTTKPLVNATSTRQGLSTDNAEVGGSIPPSPTRSLVERHFSPEMGTAESCCGLCSYSVWHDRVTESACALPLHSPMVANSRGTYAAEFCTAVLSVVDGTWMTRRCCPRWRGALAVAAPDGPRRRGGSCRPRSSARVGSSQR